MAKRLIENTFTVTAKTRRDVMVAAHKATRSFFKIHRKLNYKETFSFFLRDEWKKAKRKLESARKQSYLGGLEAVTRAVKRENAGFYKDPHCLRSRLNRLPGAQSFRF